MSGWNECAAVVHVQTLLIWQRKKKIFANIRKEEYDMTEIKEKDIQQIVAYLKSIQYGSVTIVIQDGKIVQIDKNEKIRLR